MREPTDEICNVIIAIPPSKLAVFTQPNTEAKGVRLITRKQRGGQSAKGSMCNGGVLACYQHNLETVSQDSLSVKVLEGILRCFSCRSVKDLIIDCYERIDLLMVDPLPGRLGHLCVVATPTAAPAANRSTSLSWHLVHPSRDSRARHREAHTSGTTSTSVFMICRIDSSPLWNSFHILPGEMG